MDGGGGSWSLLTIVGPILLAAVLLWAILKNRKRSAAERDLTERATRANYDREDAASKAAEAEQRNV